MNTCLRDLIKRNKEVIIIVVILLILILFRSVGKDHFKSDVKKWGVPSLKQSDIILTEELGMTSGKNLIIILDKGASNFKVSNVEKKNIPADSILNKRNLNLIFKHDGPVILFSSNPGVSARIWMLLSQMGKKNLFILSNQADNDVLKYKFKPDSLIRQQF